MVWYHVKRQGHDTSVRHTIKVSIELPVATRRRRDMTEKLLKVTLNPNKQQQQTGCPSKTDQTVRLRRLISDIADTCYLVCFAVNGLILHVILFQ